VSAADLRADEQDFRRRIPFVLYPICFILLYFYVTAFQSTFIDDAFIQFQYADTLTKSGTWGFFPGYQTNTATSPLNVLILSVFTLLTGSAVTGAILFTAFLLLLLLIILQNLSLKLFGNSFFGLFLFSAILANPLFLSSLGMEVILFVVLWIASLSLFVHHRWRFLAVCLALLTLARPDGFLMFLIIAIFLAFSSINANEKLLFIAIYIAALLPWHVYAWFQLGSLLPDTLFIKMSQEAWLGNISFGSGLWNLYFARFPLEMILSCLPLPFAAFAIRSSNHEVRSVLLISFCYGLFHYACYTALKVPPYHWYYAHLALTIAIAGSIGIAMLLQRSANWKYVLLMLPLSPLAYIAAGFPLKEAPIHTNWATHDQYKQAGEWIRQNTDPQALFIMGAEIGTLAYYSDRTLLNNFSNQWTLERVLDRNLGKKAAWKQGLFRLNFLWRKEAKRYPRANYRIYHVLHPQKRATNPNVIYSCPTSTKWIREGILYLRENPEQ
jgi:hypothetical protein